MNQKWTLLDLGLDTYAKSSMMDGTIVKEIVTNENIGKTNNKKEYCLYLVVVAEWILDLKVALLV